MKKKKCVKNVGTYWRTDDPLFSFYLGYGTYQIIDRRFKASGTYRYLVHNPSKPTNSNNPRWFSCGFLEDDKKISESLFLLENID